MMKNEIPKPQIDTGLWSSLLFSSTLSSLLIVTVEISEKVPVHWTFGNMADVFAPAWLVAVGFPLTIMGLYFLIRAANREKLLSGDRARTFAIAVTIILGVQALIGLQAAELTFSPLRVGFVLLALILFIVGNYLPKQSKAALPTPTPTNKSMRTRGLVLIAAACAALLLAFFLPV